MASADEKKVESRILAPVCATERGHHFHINADAKGERIIYCSGTSVVIRNLADPSIAEVFSGHKCKVTAAKFSPSGYWVASGDEHGKVIIWAPGTHKKKLETGVSQGVTDIDWSDDSKRVVAVGRGSGKYGRCFDWEKGNSFGDVTGHTKVPLAVAFKPGRPYRLATCGEDKIVCFHEGPPFKFKRSYKGHTNTVNCVRYSPDGSKFVTVSSDKKINIFEGKTGELVKTLEAKEGHKGSIYSVSWNPESTKIITGAADKTCKVWDVESGAVETTFTFGTELEQMQVGVLWTKTEILSVSLSGNINVLDPAAPDTPKRTIYGHMGELTDITCDRTNNAVYSGDSVGRVIRWDLATGLGAPINGAGHRGGITAVAANCDGTGWWSIGQDDQVRFNTGTDYGGAASAVGGAVIDIVAHPSDPQLAITGVKSGKVVVIRGSNVASSVDVSYKVTSLAMSPDGVILAVGGDDKKIHTFNLAGDNLTEANSTTTGHLHPVTALTFSQDGGLLGSADARGGQNIWAPADLSMKNKYAWAAHTASVKGMCFAPGKIVSVGLDERLIKYTDFENFRDTPRDVEEEVHGGGCNKLILTDDNHVLSCGADRALRITTL